MMVLVITRIGGKYRLILRKVKKGRKLYGELGK